MSCRWEGVWLTRFVSVVTVAALFYCSQASWGNHLSSPWRRGRTMRCEVRALCQFCPPHRDWRVGPSRRTDWTTLRGLWTSPLSLENELTNTLGLACKDALKVWTPTPHFSHDLNLDSTLCPFLKSCEWLFMFRSFGPAPTFHCWLRRALIGSRWVLRLLCAGLWNSPGQIWNGDADWS